MTREVVLRPEARDDIREGRRWYESQSVGLGAEYLRSVERCVARIERSPDLYPIVDEVTRRARLRRFGTHPLAAWGSPVTRSFLTPDDIVALALGTE